MELTDDPDACMQFLHQHLEDGQLDNILVAFLANITYIAIHMYISQHLDVCSLVPYNYS